MRFTCALLCALATLPAFAQTFPSQLIYKTVADDAGVISSDDAGEIESTANRLMTETGFPMEVVTISSLHAQHSDDLQSYAEALFAFWASDSARRHRGIVLLVSPGDRKVWIELGNYWGPYEDEAVQRIEQDVFIPAMKTYGYSFAIRHTVTSLATMARRDRGNDVRYLWLQWGFWCVLTGITIAGAILGWRPWRNA
jgi:uncharacterized membrane protein YgcG